MNPSHSIKPISPPTHLPKTRSTSFSPTHPPTYPPPPPQSNHSCITLGGVKVFGRVASWLLESFRSIELSGDITGEDLYRTDMALATQIVHLCILSDYQVGQPTHPPTHPPTHLFLSYPSTHSLTLSPTHQPI